MNIQNENERLHQLFIDFMDTFATAKERIAWRVRTDHERALAAQRKDLYNWTVNVYWPEIERKVEMASPRRGRPAKATQATQLLEALEFVAVGTNDNEEYQNYVSLIGNMAIATNGQVSAGHPIAEELTLCPRLDRLKFALQKCGKSLVISETPGYQLSVKGDKLRALVPCIQSSELPHVAPDMPLVELGDRLKEAFRVCGTLASEAGKRVIEASLLLEANTCTGTDGYRIMQYWHGIDLPPAMVIPKVFAAGIVKQSKPITGFGFSWGHDGKVSSVTIWFEGGAWIKTQCYQDSWPDIGHLLNVNSFPVEVPKELFEGIEAVSNFNDENFVTFGDGKVMSHDSDAVGAVYEVAGLQAGKKFNGKLMKPLAPFVKTIDLTTFEDRAFFFGGEPSNPIRGIIIAQKAIVNQSQPEYQSPDPTAQTEFPGEQPEDEVEVVNTGWGNPA